jgi:hypothetical protein
MEVKVRNMSRARSEAEMVEAIGAKGYNALESAIDSLPDVAGLPETTKAELVKMMGKVVCEHLEVDDSSTDDDDDEELEDEDDDDEQTKKRKKAARKEKARAKKRKREEVKLKESKKLRSEKVEADRIDREEKEEKAVRSLASKIASNTQPLVGTDITVKVNGAQMDDCWMGIRPFVQSVRKQVEGSIVPRRKWNEIIPRLIKIGSPAATRLLQQGTIFYGTLDGKKYSGLFRDLTFEQQCDVLMREYESPNIKATLRERFTNVKRKDGETFSQFFVRVYQLMVALAKDPSALEEYEYEQLLQTVMDWQRIANETMCEKIRESYRQAMKFTPTATHQERWEALRDDVQLMEEEQASKVERTESATQGRRKAMHGIFAIQHPISPSPTTARPSSVNAANTAPGATLFVRNGSNGNNGFNGGGRGRGRGNGGGRGRGNSYSRGRGRGRGGFGNRGGRGGGFYRNGGNRNGGYGICHNCHQPKLPTDSWYDHHAKCPAQQQQGQQEPPNQNPHATLNVPQQPAQGGNNQRQVQFAVQGQHN